MKRRAPDSGYVGGAKNQYRRDVWAQFRRSAAVQRWPRSECHVLLMPSAEGKEIEVAEAAGFRRRNMHVVDANAAIVAHLTRRYPGIRTYGCSVGHAAERIAASGVRLSFANLDLCGQVSRRLSHELARFAQSGCLDEFAYVAVTQLRGRESAGSQSYLREGMTDDPRSWLKESWKAVFERLSSFDVSRVLFIGVHLAYMKMGLKGVFPIRCGTYQSTAGTQSMLWSVWQVVQPIQAAWKINPNLNHDLTRFTEGAAL